jgi:hypothetical protein
MHGTITRIAALAIGAGIAAVFAVAFVRSPASNATTARANPAPACAHRLLTDWRDGRIDGTYPLGCYREALRNLPTDVRMYSSAEDDIRQAMAARIVQSSGRPVRSPS